MSLLRHPAGSFVVLVLTVLSPLKASSANTATSTDAIITQHLNISEERPTQAAKQPTFQEEGPATIVKTIEHRPSGIAKAGNGLVVQPQGQTTAQWATRHTTPEGPSANTAQSTAQPLTQQNLPEPSQPTAGSAQTFGETRPFPKAQIKNYKEDTIQNTISWSTDIPSTNLLKAKFAHIKILNKNTSQYQEYLIAPGGNLLLPSSQKLIVQKCLVHPSNRKESYALIIIKSKDALSSEGSKPKTSKYNVVQQTWLSARNPGASLIQSAQQDIMLIKCTDDNPTQGKNATPQLQN